MADIMIGFTDAYTPGRFEEFVSHVAQRNVRARVNVLRAFWREANQLPNVQPGDRIYVVYNSLLRGYAPLVQHHPCDGKFLPLDLNAAAFVPCSLEWRYGPDFRYSWRGVRFNEACLHPFPEWATATELPEEALLAAESDAARRSRKTWYAMAARGTSGMPMHVCMMPECGKLIRRQRMFCDPCWAVIPDTMRYELVELRQLLTVAGREAQDAMREEIESLCWHYRVQRPEPAAVTA